MSSAIEKLSDIMELNAIDEYMDDPKVTAGLLKLASILAKPEINPHNVARHVVECQALASHYALKGKYYMTIGKDDPDSNTARTKKNIYMTLREEFTALSGSLKYLVRAQT